MKEISISSCHTKGSYIFQSVVTPPDIDITIPNLSVSSGHDEQFPLAVVPVLSLDDTRFGDVDADLTTVRSSVYQFCKLLQLSQFILKAYFI